MSSSLDKPQLPDPTITEKNEVISAEYIVCRGVKQDSENLQTAPALEPKMAVQALIVVFRNNVREISCPYFNETKTKFPSPFSISPQTDKLCTASTTLTKCVFAKQEQPSAKEAEILKILDQSFAVLNLDTRSMNALSPYFQPQDSTKISTIRDLLQQSEKQLLHRWGLGRKSLENIRKALAEKELKIGMLSNTTPNSLASKD